ncbi:uncharacterized protein si:ch211-217g15.3 [Dunckerocampus dactyliophorus]|uniref:uncharacterized protein si:ch211-217g15.3 n=1 Tax=Dunckerocampus dactyliophorus TaxID=161453 RepID=UPI00240630CC|nr:uncharacterized protein si:ch211-217g15.3 [Dunckerocampus dactyliophorus]
MLRITLLVCLIFGVAAKPYKQCNQLNDKAFQDTVMSRKRALSVEVEPPEDMDQTDIDIDPKMKIWESMSATGNVKQAVVAEEDTDDVRHPSNIKDQLQKNQARRGDTDTKCHSAPDGDREEPEQDFDAIYHKAREELHRYSAPLTAEYKYRVRFPQPVPEEGEPLAQVRRHVEPEEDKDDMHHPDVESWIQYQDDTKAAPVDWPSESKYSQPEEELDHLYHH